MEHKVDFSRKKLSCFSGVNFFNRAKTFAKKGLKSRKSRKFLPAKISTLQVEGVFITSSMNDISVKINTIKLSLMKLPIQSIILMRTDTYQRSILVIVKRDQWYTLFFIRTIL